MDSKVIAYILLGAGALSLLGFISGGGFAELVIGGGASFLGWRIYRRSQKSLPNQPKTQQFELNDEMITRLARRLGGKLSAQDLASQTSLGLEEAKQRLEKMHSQGLCEIDLDDIREDGRIFYRF